jgi:hypothetical protein
MNRPVGVLMMLAVMAGILIVEPSLRWFLLPTMMLGGVVAFMLHRSRSSFFNETNKGAVDIRIDRIPVSGGIMGAVFAVGTVAIFLVALPEVRWFLLLAIPFGMLMAVILIFWHARNS